MLKVSLLELWWHLLVLLHVLMKLLKRLQQFFLLFKLWATPVLNARGSTIALQIFIEFGLLSERWVCMRLLWGNLDLSRSAPCLSLTLDRSHEKAPLLLRTTRMQLSVDMGQWVLPALVHEGTHGLRWALAAISRAIFVVFVKRCDYIRSVHLIWNFAVRVTVGLLCYWCLLFA